jgi:hypothetical protein
MLEIFTTRKFTHAPSHWRNFICIFFAVFTDRVIFSAEHHHELDHVENPAWLMNWSGFEQILRISGKKLIDFL